MTRQKACFRFLFLVIAVMLLASVIGLAACTKPATVAPSPAPAPAQTPAPTPAQTPAPTPAPVPSPQPEEDTEELVATSGGPVSVHFFWGYVKTDAGSPAANAQVTAWISGELKDSVTTDSSGKYGKDPLTDIASYLIVNGQAGDTIVFKVDGVVAEETRQGVLVEVGGEYQWQWQDLDPGWQTVLVADKVSGIDLSY